MQLKEKKTSMERDKRKLESELEKQRQTIGKQVFLQVVQKRQQTDSPTQFSEQTAQAQANSSQSESPVPSQASSNSPNTSISNKEGSRRQWDKTQKNFIDLENDTNQNSRNKLAEAPTGASSVSSMSTPSSSASQSPPLTNNSNAETKQTNLNDMAANLSKSRDEVVKAIASLNNMTKVGNKFIPSSQNTSNNMVKDIEVLNNKLTELQSEINRLTLLQHNQPNGKASPQVNKSYNIIEEKKSLENEIKLEAEEKVEEASDENGAFFISFGSGTAKREKPPALTPKKNLIFVKTNEDKQNESKKSTNQSNNNLLMTAKPSTVGINENSLSNDLNLNDGNDGDIDGGSSDGDSSELKQRKKR